jgi:hypothetical protein
VVCLGDMFKSTILFKTCLICSTKQILILTKLWNLFRWFKPAAESFVKVPFLGAVSHLTLAVCPFCVAFAVVWAVFRQLPFAWIGQDILVSMTICSIRCLPF